MLGSGGGGRGRRRWPHSRLRSCRGRRSVGTRTSEARGGAATAASSRRRAPGAALGPASAPRTAPAAPAERGTHACPAQRPSAEGSGAFFPPSDVRGPRLRGKTWRPQPAGSGARRTAGTPRWGCAEGPVFALPRARALPGAHEHHAPADTRPAFLLLLCPRRLRPQDRQHRSCAEHAEARADVP